MSLAPREHGTYGQLLLPLAAAHLTGSPSCAAWLFTVAAVAAFLSHEPLLIVLGKRGGRARLRDSPHALRLLLLTPMLVTSLAVAAWPPHPRHLRRRGWILLVASAITGVLLIA